MSRGKNSQILCLNTLDTLAVQQYFLPRKDFIYLKYTEGLTTTFFFCFECRWRLCLPILWIMQGRLDCATIRGNYIICLERLNSAVSCVIHWQTGKGGGCKTYATNCCKLDQNWPFFLDPPFFTGILHFYFCLDPWL